MKKVVANKSNNNVTVLQTDPTSTTTLEYFFGGLAVSSFIITWIASLLSPIVLFFALKRGYHFTSASIICITIIAYLPWDHGLISKYFQDFLNRYHPLYYSGGVSLVFEDGETPTTNSKQHRQTFYAVHPHGAFCSMGIVISQSCNEGGTILLCTSVICFTALSHICKDGKQTWISGETRYSLC